jgi:hypothetical protein
MRVKLPDSVIVKIKQSKCLLGFASVCCQNVSSRLLSPYREKGGHVMGRLSTPHILKSLMNIILRGGAIIVLHVVCKSAIDTTKI